MGWHASTDTGYYSPYCFTDDYRANSSLDKGGSQKAVQSTV